LFALKDYNTKQLEFPSEGLQHSQVVTKATGWPSSWQQQTTQCLHSW